MASADDSTLHGGASKRACDVKWFPQHRTPKRQPFLFLSLEKEKQHPLLSPFERGRLWILYNFERKRREMGRRRSFFRKKCQIQPPLLCCLIDYRSGRVDKGPFFVDGNSSVGKALISAKKNRKRKKKLLTLAEKKKEEKRKLRCGKSGHLFCGERRLSVCPGKGKKAFPKEREKKGDYKFFSGKLRLLRPWIWGKTLSRKLTAIPGAKKFFFYLLLSVRLQKSFWRWRGRLRFFPKKKRWCKKSRLCFRQLQSLFFPVKDVFPNKTWREKRGCSSLEKNFLANRTSGNSNSKQSLYTCKSLPWPEINPSDPAPDFPGIKNTFYSLTIWSWASSWTLPRSCLRQWRTRRCRRRSRRWSGTPRPWKKIIRNSN